MKRVTYLLKDEMGSVQARWTLPEKDTPALEPWMIHNHQVRGWRLEAWEAADSGVQIHGWADWHGVADGLAEALRVFLDEDAGFETEEQAEEFHERSKAALDNYYVAQMEVNVATADAEPQRDPDAPEGEPDAEA
jgi:hypothetical protein